MEPLRVMIEEGIKKRRSLPRLRSLSLRNSGTYIHMYLLYVYMTVGTVVLGCLGRRSPTHPPMIPTPRPLNTKQA